MTHVICENFVLEVWK